jgi:hypothetical protein
MNYIANTRPMPAKPNLGRKPIYPVRGVLLKKGDSFSVERDFNGKALSRSKAILIRNAIKQQAYNCGIKNTTDILSSDGGESYVVTIWRTK